MFHFTKNGHYLLTKFITLDVIDVDTEDSLGHLTELSEEIEFKVLLPAELKNVKSGYKRTFYVALEHNGENKLVDAKLSDDGKYITFKSKKFSTYMLTYEDTVVKDSDKATISPPATIDSVVFYGIFAFIALIGVVFGYKYLKKYSN